MREKAIETKLVRAIVKLGGWIVKMTCQGTNGMPDRIIFMPGGKIWLVECKRPKGTPDEVQKYVHRKLQSYGIPVYVVYDEITLNKFLHAIQCP